MPFKKGVPRSPRAGRRKGTPNKFTVLKRTVLAYAESVFQDPRYQAALMRRVHRGKAHKTELYFLQLLGGKPRQTIEVPGLETLAATLRGAIAGGETAKEEAEPPQK